MSDPLRVAVVGANWGRQHLAARRAVSGVELYAICTAHRETAEAAAREHDVPRACWNVAELLADPAVDVVDVTPRPTVRAPIVLAALAAGKHVLQPLPFALDLAQAAELERRAADAHLVTNVENLHRHAPAFLAAKALVDEGFLGDVYTVEGEVRTGILLDRPPGYRYEWITHAKSGASALRNFGAQLLHCLTWMFGPVAAVSATVARNEPGETEDAAFVLVRYAGGASGTVHASWCTTAGAGFRIDAAGSRGRLVLRADGLGPDGAVLATARRGERGLTEVAIPERFRALDGVLTELPPGPRGYPLAAMCQRFAEAVRSGEPGAAGPDFREAQRVMRIVETAYAAADAGSWIAVAA